MTMKSLKLGKLAAAGLTAAVLCLIHGAVLAQTLHFVHPDHLNTPRVITNQASQVVWRWDQTEPFGADPANENPTGLGAFVYNLRLPGQHFDKETNLHYNYFRDYDPGIGRYVESDPIGLRGGINTYAYVNGNPLRFVDLLGLDPADDKLIEKLIGKTGEGMRVAAFENLLAEACITRNCLRGGTVRTYFEAFGDCQSELDRLEKMYPGISAAISTITRSSAGVLPGCAEKCERGTNAPGFKGRCTRACAPGGGGAS
jgi:RHS repeat-associated protein